MLSPATQQTEEPIHLRALSGSDKSNHFDVMDLSD
jgi:hypothetical protein